jgi:2-polyprenyl-6-methoxyphenol hydroxylase-like FAD-dependent oxidoreductase
MARIVVIGGGVVGLCTSMLLARDGHDVTVFERDPAVPPDPGDAWNDWERKGVNQFRLLHFFQPRFRQIMDDNLPEVTRAFIDAGALSFNPLREMPEEFSGGFRDTDARFDAVTARRPVAESVVASVAATTDHLQIRRGVAIAGLLCGEPTAAGVPNVVGVRTESGEEIRADLVVDMGGRRSALPRMLTEIGARAPIEEIADCGFVYYGRHFRSSDGSLPPMFGPPLQEYGTFSTLSLPADNGTWGLGIVTSAHDPALRAVKDVDVYTNLVKSCPMVAHWLDGEPLDDQIMTMAKIEDRHRTFVIDGQPVATGVVAAGDAWACTNPSVGRGISIGMVNGETLRDVLRDSPDDPVELQRAWHEATQETSEPWYRATLAFDEGRLGEIDALLDGREYEGSPEFQITKAMLASAAADPDILRAFLKIGSVLETPDQVLAEPGLFEKIIDKGGNWRDQQLPGPTREEVLAIVGA